MEFRKMLTITLYARQQKRHRCIEQSFGLCGRGRGWENGIETCILSYVKRIINPGLMHETGFRDWCTGMTQRDVMGREVGGGCSGLGPYLHPWQIHVNVCQNQYNIVKKTKITVINELLSQWPKKKKKKR